MAGLIAPWKSMPMSTSGPTVFRSSANFSMAYATSPGVSTYRAGRRLAGPVLNAVKPELDVLAHLLRGPRVRVCTDSIAGGSAEQFVYRHAESLALDVP